MGEPELANDASIIGIEPLSLGVLADRLLKLLLAIELVAAIEMRGHISAAPSETRQQDYGDELERADHGSGRGIRL